MAQRHKLQGKKVIGCIVVLIIAWWIVKRSQESKRSNEENFPVILENLPVLPYAKLAKRLGINIPGDFSPKTSQEFARFFAKKGFSALYFVADIPSLKKALENSLALVVFICDFEVGRGYIFAYTSPYIVKKIEEKQSRIILEKVIEDKENSLSLSCFEYLWDRAGNFAALLCQKEKTRKIERIIGAKAFKKYKEIACVLNEASYSRKNIKSTFYNLIEKFPDWNYPSYVLVREVLLPEGETGEAQEVVDKMNVQNSFHPYHKLLKALVFAYKGDYTSAAKIGSEVEEFFKRKGYLDLEGVYWLAFFFKQAGEPRRGEAIINWALDSSSFKRELLILRSFYRFENKLYDLAIQDIEKALLLPQEKVFPLWQTLLMEAYGLKGNIKKCEEIAKEIDKISPKAKALFWVKGIELLKEGRWEELSNWIEEAYKNEDKNITSYIVPKAFALLNMGGAKRARQFLESQPLLRESLRGKVTNVGLLPLYSVYGTSLYRCGELGKAREILYKAYKSTYIEKGIRWFLGPYEISWLVHTLYFLGLVLYDQGKKEEAIYFLKEAINWKISFPEKEKALKLISEFKKSKRGK